MVREPAVGEHWAYRKRGVDPLTEVRVESVGTNKPARVKVAFLDDSFEGHIEWVPPSRLKVPWDERGPFLAREAAWAALETPEVSELERSAIEIVLEAFVSTDVAWPDQRRRGNGLLWVHNRPALEAVVDPKLLDSDLAVVEDDVLYLPADVSLKVARWLARNKTEALAAHLEKRHDTLHRHASTGYVSGYGRRSIFIEPKWAQEDLEDFVAAARLIAEWTGTQAILEQRALNRSRQLLQETTQIANDAINQLVEAGMSDAAWRLHVRLYPTATRKQWEPIAQMAARRDAEAARRARQLQEELAEARLRRINELKMQHQADIDDLFNF